MARLPQRQMDPAIMDLMAMAQLGQSMGLNEPPPMAELIKLLGVASEMHGREQDMMIKQQALENERQKQAQMTPEMFQALTLRPEISGSPEASRALIERVAGPGLLPPPTSPTPEQLPDLGQPSLTAGKTPKGRRAVESQKPFLGYEPPPGSEDVEAVLDEQGNIINFVRRGTKQNVADFVPTAGSVGGWGASKYAVAQQMKSLGQLLGLAPKPQTVRPY